MEEALRILEIVARAAGYPEAKSLPEIVAALIGTVLSLIGLVFFCLVLLGGFRWMVSGGNTEKVLQAKQTLLNAVIGLALVLAAYSITQFVMVALLKASG